VFGASGQDGSILCEKLLERGDIVIAVCASASRPRLEEYLGPIWSNAINLHIVYTDYKLESISSLFLIWDPEVVIKCSGQSYVGKSWKYGEETADSQYRFTALLLDMLEVFGKGRTKFIDLGSAEMFAPSQYPLEECSLLGPRNPYGCAKYSSFSLTKVYREFKQQPACTAILFPHESVRRGKDFATKKFARELVCIKLGLSNHMKVGRLSIVRDWSSAYDIVSGILMLVDSERVDDYIFSSGIGLSIREVIRIMAECIGLENIFDIVEEDPNLMRPEEPQVVIGNPLKAYRELGWKTTTSQHTFLCEIVQSQLQSMLKSLDRFS
jgi:GDPmannose 4,6-dehydratase